MNKTILSLIVIGYNVEKYVKNCLESIINQSNDNIEIIFIDDGSTDNTKNIVKKLFLKNENFKYFYQKNAGANRARINGYLKAKGKYIGYVDGDDELEKNYINTIMCNLSENPDLIQFNYKINDNNLIIKNERFVCKNYDNYDFLRDLMILKIPHYLWNKVYKKEFLDKINFSKIPNITMGDDIVANVYLGANKPKVKSINDILYVYYFRKSSVSRVFNDKFLELNTMLDEIEIILKNKKIFFEFYKELEFQYYRVFLHYVVESKTNSEIIEKLYQKYKLKKINKFKNNYIMLDLKKQHISKKILLLLYEKKYSYGKKISNLYLKLRRK